LPHPYPPPCRGVMFVRNYELAARRCSAITLGRPTAGSTSIGASSGPEDPAELLHNLLHVPELWRLTRGIISSFFDSP
jgi:hypothetical protein